MTSFDNKPTLDVLIIGAGPIGLACGIEAKKRNLSYLIVEKGCLVNSLYHYPKNMTFFSTSEKLEIGDVPFVSHLPKPNRVEALEYYRRVAMQWQLNLNQYEEVKTIVKNSSFEVLTTRRTYLVRNVVVATGFYDLPFKLNVPGEELPKVKHYYDEPHPYFGQQVAIVGAANSAVDAALETYRKGAHVTMIIRRSQISPRVKYWVKPDIENRIKEGSIKALFNSTILSISEEDINVTTPEGIITIPNDFVLAMTGYEPSFDFLNKIGVQLGQDEMLTPQHNPETMETNVEGLYLAGVVCGGLQTNKWFIENSRVHAETIMNQIAIG